MEADLTIDDVLAAVEALANREHQSVDAVLLELARRARNDDRAFIVDEDGFPVLIPSSGIPTTLELVNALRDEYP